MEGFGLPTTRAASADKNAIVDIPCNKPEEWPPCVSQTKAQQQSERPTNSELKFQDKIMARFNDDERYQLKSNEANYVHFKCWSRTQIIVSSTSQHNTTRGSARKFVRTNAEPRAERSTIYIHVQTETLMLLMHSSLAVHFLKKKF